MGVGVGVGGVGAGSLPPSPPFQSHYSNNQILLMTTACFIWQLVHMAHWDGYLWNTITVQPASVLDCGKQMTVLFLSDPGPSLLALLPPQSTPASMLYSPHMRSISGTLSFHHISRIENSIQFTVWPEVIWVFPRQYCIFKCIFNGVASSQSICFLGERLIRFEVLIHIASLYSVIGLPPTGNNNINRQLITHNCITIPKWEESQN